MRGLGLGLGAASPTASTWVQSAVEEVDLTLLSFFEQMQWVVLPTSPNSWLICFRIELWDKVCRLGKSPHLSDTQAVECEREALTSHMVTLTHLQNAADIANTDIAPSQITHDNQAWIWQLQWHRPFRQRDSFFIRHFSSSSQPQTLFQLSEQHVYLPCNGRSCWCGG